MDLRLLDESFKSEYNNLVTHVIQSWEWGEFRKSLGLPLLRYGLFEKDKLIKAFQLTLHKIPFTPQYVGYLPKGPEPDKLLADALVEIGKRHKCAFIKIEPNVELDNFKLKNLDKRFKTSPKPLFTKYNFLLDLTPPEEELQSKMHPKTRYNTRLAEKRGVRVEERDDDKAVEIYLKLIFETTQRQQFYNHTPDYHRKVFKTLKDAGMAKFLIAFLDKTPLTAWMVLNFKDTLYYPYGGSSSKNREVMASNLVAWDAIKLGKRLNCKVFDMWGALGPEPDSKDPWFGFHRFKQGYGGRLAEYLGTYDLVFNPILYYIFTNIDKFTKLKVILLKLLGK